MKQVSSNNKLPSSNSWTIYPILCKIQIFFQNLIQSLLPTFQCLLSGVILEETEEHKRKV